jgi:hypothetical protein
VMISSWNDWEENTAIEPGFMYDGYAGDPYLYCRIVAAAKGLDFVPPPLPPKESVDPLMWQRLYGIDRTPPRLTRVRSLPLEAAIVAEVGDSGSGVADVGLRDRGDLTIGDGLTASAAPDAEGAFTIASGKSLVLAIDRARLAADDWWVAVECDDAAAGRLTVRYPAARDVGDNRPGDEGHIAMRAAITLAGRSTWRADARPLRLVDPDRDAPLTLTWEGKDGPLRVSRVHLFRSGTTMGTAGLEISGAAAGSQIKTYRLDAPGLQRRPLPAAAYLLLRDAAGNVSPPIPVAAGRFTGGVGNRP